MDFKADIGNIMQEAQKMQERMQQAQEELANTTVEGISGAGLVKVTMNGKHELVDVNINKTILEDEDPEMIEDLFQAAVNSAVAEIEKISKDKINDLTQGLQLPEGFGDTGA